MDMCCLYQRNFNFVYMISHELLSLTRILNTSKLSMVVIIPKENISFWIPFTFPLSLEPVIGLSDFFLKIILISYLLPQLGNLSLHSSFRRCLQTPEPSNDKIYELKVTSDGCYEWFIPLMSSIFILLLSLPLLEPSMT